MTGKHRNWHKEWSLHGDRLVHTSGIEFVIKHTWRGVCTHAAPETLADFKDFELSRGVPMHDIEHRLIRLELEALKWLARTCK